MDLKDKLKPLTKIEYVKRITEFINILPFGLKDRYQHTTNLLNNTKDKEYSVTEIAGLIQTLETILPRFQDNISDASSESAEEECSNYIKGGICKVGVVNIFPPITKCCGILKTVSSKACTVYRSRFKPVTGFMHEIKCNTLYKCSTYKVKGQELYRKDALTLDYFMSTCDTFFSKEFLNIVDIDL